MTVPAKSADGTAYCSTIRFRVEASFDPNSCRKAATKPSKKVTTIGRSAPKTVFSIAFQSPSCENSASLTEYGYTVRHSGQATDVLCPPAESLNARDIRIGLEVRDKRNSDSSLIAFTVRNKSARLVLPFS